MPDRARVADLSGLNKRGGYSGSKPGNAMRPPVKLPASAAGRPSKPEATNKKA